MSAPHPGYHPGSTREGSAPEATPGHAPGQLPAPGYGQGYAPGYAQGPGPLPGHGQAHAPGQPPALAPAPASLAPSTAVALVVMAVPLCFFPVVRILALVPAVAALALAVVGLVQTRRTGGGGRVLAIVGTASALLVVAVATWLLVRGTEPSISAGGSVPPLTGTTQQQDGGGTALVVGRKAEVPDFLEFTAGPSTARLSADGKRVEDAGLPVTVTNSDDVAHEISADFHAMDADGTVLLWSAVEEVVLAPGESAEFKVFDFSDKPLTLPTFERAETFQLSLLTVDGVPSAPAGS